MTFVNSWKQEGIELGIEQGIKPGKEQGKQIGLQEGKLNLLLQLLAYRFNALAPEVEKQIKAMPTEKIEALSLAMFDLKGVQSLLNWLTINAPVVPPEETGTK